MTVVLNLMKRPFWLGQARGIILGDRVFRYQTSLTALDTVTVNNLAVGKKAGKTSFGLLANRVVWGKRYADNTFAIYLSRMGVGGETDFVKEMTTYANDHVLDVDSYPYTLPSAMWDGAGRSYAGFLRISKQYGMRLAFKNVQSTLANKAYNGRIRVLGSAQPASGAATDVLLDLQQMVSPKYLEVLPDGRNRVFTAVSLQVRTTSSGSEYAVNVESSNLDWSTKDWTVDGENPVGGAIRDVLGVTSYVTIPGMYQLPNLGDGDRIDAGFLHGIHQSVSAFKFDQTSKCSHVLARFSKSDMRDVLFGQKNICDATGKAQLDSAIASIENQVPAGTAFTLMLTAEQVGPYDIYTMKQVAAALADGASIADIDEQVVSNKRMSVWRAECLAAAPTSALLWADATTANELPLVSVKSKAESPYYTIATPDYVAGKSYSVATGTLQAIVTAHPANYSTVGSLLSEIETSYSISLVLLEDASSARTITVESLVNPWTDMPSAWFKRCTMLRWQPVATGLSAGITEPTSLFVV